MSVGDDLRVEICKDPDNRALRRVYADWLIEQGDPRGEWIALHDHPGDEAELKRRALWQRHGMAWRFADTGGEAVGAFGFVRYEDGFLDEVSLDSTHLRVMAPMLARQPVRKLSVHAIDELAAIAALPMLSTIERLELSLGLESSNAGALRALLEAAPRLRSLALAPRGGAAPFVWEALAGYDRVAELEELELSIRVAPHEARWIAGALPKLRALTCRRVLVDASLDALATHACFELRRLALHGEMLFDTWPEVSNACVAAALGSPMVRGLDAFTLAEYPAGPEIARALVRLPCAARLISLDLGCTGRSIMDGLSDTALPSLTRLNLRRSGLQASDLGTLARFPRLEQLVLDDNRLDDDGVRALGRSEHVRQLRHLGLSSTSCSSGAVTALIEGGRLTELRTLDLSSNGQIEWPALEALADGPFDKMEVLSVGGRTGRSSAELFEHAWLPAEGHGQDRSRHEHYQRRLALDGSAVPIAGVTGARAELTAARELVATGTYRKGERVRHAKHGIGVVRAVSALRLTVTFPGQGDLHFGLTPASAIPFDARQRYQPGQIVVHPTLGAGRVRWARHDRIEVEIADGKIHMLSLERVEPG